jgi:hypothetical protein
MDSGRGDEVLIKSGGSPRKNAALAAVCVALALSGANLQAQIISLSIAARKKKVWIAFAVIRSCQRLSDHPLPD